MTPSVESPASPARRELLKGAGAVGLGAFTLAAAGNAFAAGNPAGGHAQMHGDMAGMAHGPKNAEMVRSLHHCVMTAEVCIDHCLEMFKMGDTTLADCARSVSETMAFCDAHARMASLGAKRLKEMCELSIKMCSDCEESCRKHEKHPQCKGCADACADCIKICKAYLAA